MKGISKGIVMPFDVADEAKLFLGSSQLEDGSCREVGIVSGSELTFVAAASPQLAYDAVSDWYSEMRLYPVFISNFALVSL